VQLAAAQDGHVGRIVRISDRNPVLLRHLEASAFHLDATVQVVGRKPFGGALVVSVDGAEHDLGDEAAQAVWLSLG
jgi:DtxR family Mn-dependent transcriptional regulator